MASAENTQQTTPIEVIANISRVVSMVVDRLTGDRVDFPLLVAAAVVEALKNFSIESRVMYGPAAWVEVTEDNSLIWAGCWGQNFHFWVATQYGEVVDLNASVAYRKRPHDNPQFRAAFSPPMLWSHEVPRFYRYIPEGIAELELTEEKDIKRYELVLQEIREKCNPKTIAESKEQDFPNEPILCPGRKLLDDSRGTFRQYDRVVGVRGIPTPPI